MYAVGLLAYGYYFLLELDAGVMLRPSDRLILLGAGCLCVYFGSFSLSRSVSGQAARQVMRLTFRAFFVLYLLLLLTFTLFDDAFGRNLGPEFVWESGKSWAELSGSVNIHPFRTISLYFRNIQSGAITYWDFFINIFGNLLAFMPFALFLPLLYPRMRSPWRFLLAMAAVILSIEAAQFVFQRGCADVDDFILNLTGALLLYVILKAPPFKRLIDRLTMRGRDNG